MRKLRKGLRTAPGIMRARCRLGIWKMTNRPRSVTHSLSGLFVILAGERGSYASFERSTSCIRAA